MKELVIQYIYGECKARDNIACCMKCTVTVSVFYIAMLKFNVFVLL